VHVVSVRSRISVRHLVLLLSADLRDLLWRPVLGHGLEEGIDHAVGVSLATLHPEAAVEEPCVKQHLPHYWMTPVVRSHLRVDRDAEVVVPCFKNLRDGHHLIKGDAYEILTKLLEGSLEGCLVVLALAHRVADNTVSITNEEKDSASVDSI